MAPVKSKWSYYKYEGYNGSTVVLHNNSCVALPDGKAETVLVRSIRKLNFF